MAWPNLCALIINALPHRIPHINVVWQPILRFSFHFFCCVIIFALTRSCWLWLPDQCEANNILVIDLAYAILFLHLVRTQRLVIKREISRFRSRWLAANQRSGILCSNGDHNLIVQLWWALKRTSALSDIVRQGGWVDRPDNWNSSTWQIILW